MQSNSLRIQEPNKNIVRKGGRCQYDKNKFIDKFILNVLVFNKLNIEFLSREAEGLAL
ncbi:hypothetical protein CLOSBL3_10162 [Clostridiaceae bacterium BL-3]|nr:hypothetical protein CLOSBL3_10162 [Clostridiaceae bacterium BL-3]